MPRVDITKNQIRRRQMDPSKCAAGSFRVKHVGKRGTQLVVCCPKGHWSKRAKRCKVGMKVQSIRKRRRRG